MFCFNHQLEITQCLKLSVTSVIGKKSAEYNITLNTWVYSFIFTLLHVLFNLVRISILILWKLRFCQSQLLMEIKTETKSSRGILSDTHITDSQFCLENVLLKCVTLWVISCHFTTKHETRQYVYIVFLMSALSFPWLLIKKSDIINTTKTKNALWISHHLYTTNNKPLLELT